MPVPEMLDNSGEELARLRVQNAALQKALDESIKGSQQYLQNVAHQLTAPLGAIKWSIEALKKKEVPLARKQKLLSSIYSQATILVHLIKNFALMSDLEADHELGQFREKPERVDLCALSINLANDFQPQASEAEKGIVVDELSLSPGSKGRTVLAVKNLIAQALSNLLENAVKYSDSKTTVTVKGVVVPFKDDKSGMGVSVTSIGIPVSADEVARLQERGFRGGAARQKVPAGTGIGLYLASRIMALHHGTLTVQGKGKESTFSLVFPPSRVV